MTSSSFPRPGRFEVTRPALLTRLADALNAQVILLAAPSGYGKSSLLAQYARSTPRAAVWCRLTEAHVDPLNVATLIARAAHTYIGAAEHLTSPDPRTPESALIDALAQALLDANVNLDLIVDPVEDDHVARWLIQLALALGEGHRVLISRYSADGLRLARAVADGRAVILDAADLSFTPPETASLLEARGVTLTGETLERLQGWPAGLALAAAGSQRHVSTDDLVRDCLDSLPAELRRALPEAAALDIWCEDDARQIGAQLPPGWLTHVQRAGLPLQPLGAQQFQPHRLLRDLLDQDLRRTPHRWQQLTLAAAALAEERGETRRAARLYAEAQAPEDFLRLAAPLASQFRGRGEHQLTRQLLELVPAEQLPPEQQARLAWAQIETGDSTRGEASLHALRRAGQLPPAGLASLAMLAGRRGDTEDQYRYAREGLNRLTPGEIEPALLWPLVYAALKRGEPDDAQGAAEMFMTWARAQGDQVRLAEAWQLQAVCCRAARDVAGLAAALREARRIYDHLGWAIRAAMISLEEAELAAQSGDLPGTRRALERVPAGLDHGLHLLHARAGLLRAALAWWDADYDAALSALDDAEGHALAGQLRTQQEDVRLRRADTLLSQARRSEAHHVLDGVHPTDPARGAYRALLAALLMPGQPTPALPADPWPDAGLTLRLHALHVRHTPAQATPLQSHPLWPHLPSAERPPLSAPPTVPAPVASAAPRLTITALGDLSVRLDGHAVPIALAKSRELLVWLALHGSGTRDEIVTALWDGSAEERHVEYFRVAVRRLRGALKAALNTDPDPLPYREGRYRLGDHLDVILDARPDQPVPEDPVNLARQAQLFSQPFMPGSEGDWIQELRDRCQLRSAQLGLALAATPGADAPAAFRQVLQVDPWSDAAHQGLIRSLLHAERRAEAEQALRIYAAVLRDEFGTTPPADFLHDVGRRGLT
ncbi:BTAD domain-containing putative transcriptional regulator [Deinococcus sedimenti]|uniref:Bacterial transcriptional activator domain-containing protein n=1 Tax=Deinococcus sedimenti TaxID=1867090 RepID=A0ABQ2S284_9DEIO|nr:BTAD domain-containing putative transcriptional regulator [Deinococcus sedimenti]GGR81460.1 hypothetical protein GCM10008960_05500 [Deinococcus sedimenti]